MSSKEMYVKGSEMVVAAGFTVSGYSVCDEDFVSVFSREAKAAMPKVEFVATMKNGEWVIETYTK